MIEKNICIDAHVHIYPIFDIEYIFTAFEQNVNNLNSSTAAEKPITKFIILSERSDCCYFPKLTKDIHLDDYFVESLTSKMAVAKNRKNDSTFYIVAGRQIVSSENLEICSIGSTWFPADKKFSAFELAEHILSDDGLPVLNWAPGKWFFSRKPIVEKLLDSANPQNLLIGDIAMRPTIWPEPLLMRKAREKGFKIIAGSDPLPFKNEEWQTGKYGSAIRGFFDPENPWRSLKELLQSADTQINSFGDRRSSFNFAKNQIKIMLEKRKRKQFAAFVNVF